MVKSKRFFACVKFMLLGRCNTILKGLADWVSICTNFIICQFSHSKILRDLYFDDLTID